MNAYVFISELPLIWAGARTMVEVSHNSHAIWITKFTGVRHPSREFELDILVLESHGVN